MNQGWFEKLESQPVRKTPEELEADAWIVSERARLRAEAAERDAREQAERAAVEARTPHGSSVAAYEARKHLLPKCGNEHERWCLLTTGKPAGATW